MKIVLAALACLLGLGLLALFLVTSRPGVAGSAPAGGASPAPIAVDAPAIDSARVEALESTLRNLEPAMARLERRLAELEADPRREATGLGSAGSSTPTSAPQDERDALWYLERYVASFAPPPSNGGRGSEYFRLAVDAYAEELPNEIAALIGDSRRPSELRRRLAEMLGSERFAGHGIAIDTLLAALSERGETALGETALASLGVIADRGTALAIERLVWTLDEQLRQAALRLIVRLSGIDANRALARLFATAPTDADRASLLKLLTPDDPQTAIALLELASTLEHGIRLAGARALREFHTPEALALIDAWLAVERAPDVRRVLEESRSKSGEIDSWDAMQASGPPNANPSRDDPNAWACKQPDMGIEWLELTYPPALRANLVRIFEVNVPGAIARVLVHDEGGVEHTLWSGADPTAIPGVFELTMATTPYRIARLRLELDTDRRPGWSEIDAVELAGPDGRAWAASARASSNYGD